MAEPTLFVVGDAEREVTPDRALVRVDVQTPVLRTAQEALGRAADARRRLLDHLEAALPEQTITDARITTRQEQRQVAAKVAGTTETRWQVAGYTGLATVWVGGDASRAAEIVAAAGAHPDAERVVPAFEVSPELGRRVRDELEQEAVRDALARATGLAAAAGLAVGPVLSIGEHGPSLEPRYEEGVRMFADRAYSASAAADLAEALGELRPDRELHSARVPVRVALVAVAARSTDSG